MSLRLHLNEHTGGCSSRVLDAIRRLSAEDTARYPEDQDATRAAAAYFGVPPERVLLTNGLDEGILLASLALVRRSLEPAEVVVVEPAFEMYAYFAEAAGGRTVRVPPARDFVFPVDEVVAAISPATRLVFLTDPNNPTGQQIPSAATRRIAGAVPPGACVFLDEAYAEFAGKSFLDEIDEYPNVLVGRTFAKAFGLAGLRIGALVGAPALVDVIRRIAPPYRLNAVAVAALEAALADRGHVAGYVAESARSKQLLYEACGRMGLAYWPSAANFVLIRTGERTPRIVGALAARGILVRDRSAAPGCAGCVRVTAGLVQDTAAFVAALEEVLCAAEA